MSSIGYSTCLKPDPRIRRAVVCSGILFSAIGCMLLLSLRIDAVWRAIMCVCWSSFCWHEHARMRRSGANCLAIRCHAGGEIEIQTCDLGWIPATLQPGSVIYRRFAWLRARGEDGQLYVELLSGDARASQQWRRLQVIWRHIGAAA